MRLALSSIRFAVATLLVACAGPAFGQLCQTGSQSFGGGADEFITYFGPAPAGGLYVGGGVDSGNTDVLALSYDAGGTLLWARKFGSALDEEQEGGFVNPATSGGLYLCGAVPGAGAQSDAMILKYGHDGTLRWARAWDSGADDQAASAAMDVLGNLYLAGGSRAQNGTEDVLLLKFAPTPGTTAPVPLIARTWGSASTWESINQAVIDNSTGTEFLVAGGNIDAGGALQTDALLQKYDTSLNLIWSQAYGANGNDDAFGVAVDAAGNAYVVGVTHLGAGGEDVLLLKFDSAGLYQWGRAWGGSGDESAWAISFDAAGDLYVTGETDSFGQGGFDALLLKYGADGQLVWSMTWGGTGTDGLVFEAPAPASGPLRAVGHSEGPGHVLAACSGTSTTLSSSGLLWSPAGTTGTLSGSVSSLAGASTSYGASGGGGFDIEIVDFDRGCYPTYCTAGTSTSGCQAAIASSGVASASAASGFFLSATSVEGQKDGLFFYGTSGRQANSWGNGTSFQCVTPPVKRGGVLVGSGPSGTCGGSFSQDLNARWQALPAHNPGAGALMQAQLWFRDPLNTSNQTTSLSDAIEFEVGP